MLPTLPYFPTDVGHDEASEVVVKTRYPVIVSRGAVKDARLINDTPARRVVMTLAGRELDIQKVLAHWQQVQGRPFPLLIPGKKRHSGLVVDSANTSGTQVFDARLGSLKNGSASFDLGPESDISFNSYAGANQLASGIARGTDATAWDVQGGATSVDADPYRYLTPSASLRWDGQADTFAGFKLKGSALVAALPGEYWTASAYVHGGTAAGGQAIIDLQYRGASPTYTLLGSFNNGFADDMPGESSWERIEATGLAPASTEWAGFRIRWNTSGTDTSDVYGWADQFQLERGEIASGWCPPGSGLTKILIQAGETAPTLAGGLGHEIIAARYSNIRQPFRVVDFERGTIQIEMEEVLA